MKTKLAIAAFAAAAAIGSTAFAGAHYANPVYVATGIAYGQLHAARFSSNTKEFIGCAVMGNTTSTTTTYVSCSASDASGKSVYCSKYNPSYQLIQAAQAANEASYIIFNLNSNYECTYVYVSNNSSNL